MSLVVDFKIRRRLTGYCVHDHAQGESWYLYKGGGGRHGINIQCKYYYNNRTLEACIQVFTINNFIFCETVHATLTKGPEEQWNRFHYYNNVILPQKF